MKKEHHRPTRVMKVTQGLTNHIYRVTYCMQPGGHVQGGSKIIN